VTDLAALASESYADDVRAVADELAQATDASAFASALRELVELAARDRAFVADDSDALAVRTEAGAFRLTVEAARRNLVGLMLDSTRRRLLLVAPRCRVKIVLHPSDAAPRRPRPRCRTRSRKEGSAAGAVRSRLEAWMRSLDSRSWRTRPS
jgi:hypothetical protein